MIRAVRGISPKVPESAFVEASAQVIGDVTLGEGASVWFNAVVRGDTGPIRIGARTNIQDGAVLHCTRGDPGTDPGATFRAAYATSLGDDVTVGHAAVLHGCRIGDRVLVGMGSIVLDGAAVAEDSMIAAGSLVPPGTSFPPRSLIMGAPARVKRPLTDDEVRFLVKSAESYLGYAREHREG